MRRKRNPLGSALFYVKIIFISWNQVDKFLKMEYTEDREKTVNWTLTTLAEPRLSKRETKEEWKNEKEREFLDNDIGVNRVDWFGNNHWRLPS